MMKRLSASVLLLSVSAFAATQDEIRVETSLSDMSPRQQSEVAALVRSFDVQKFSAKLCYNYIVVVTRHDDVATCKQAIHACDLEPEESICQVQLGKAIANSTLAGKRVVECFETLKKYNSKLPAFNCLSEKSDSNMMILEQLATSRFPLEVESCIEDLRKDQIGFH